MPEASLMLPWLKSLIVTVLGGHNGRQGGSFSDFSRLLTIPTGNMAKASLVWGKNGEGNRTVKR